MAKRAAGERIPCLNLEAGGRKAAVGVALKQALGASFKAAADMAGSSPAVVKNVQITSVGRAQLQLLQLGV